MLDVLVVWHSYVSSMYIAYQYVKKSCMDLHTKLGETIAGLNVFANFNAFEIS